MRHPYRDVNADVMAVATLAAAIFVERGGRLRDHIDTALG